MVAILAFLTFAAFIAVTWFLSRGERADESAGPAGDGAIRVPARGLHTAPEAAATYLHPGHVWVRLGSDGLATVGASDFASHFAGSLSGLEAPEEGTALRQGQPAWTLISGKNRRLTQVMPLDGEVVAVNRDLVSADRPASGGSRPSAWILRVRPARLAENIQNLIGGALGDAWQEVAGMRLNAVLAPALGRVANDGGVWLDHFGDLLNESDWHSLRRDLFPSPGGADR